MAKSYLVDSKPFTAKELIKYAERQYGCQNDTALKFTSVAAECLRTHGHIVEDNNKT